MNARRLTSTLLAAATTAAWFGTAQASLATYDFSFTVAGGTLDGSTQSGQYSFDATDLTGSGAEYLTPASFSFLFNDVSYVLGDDPGATVNFFDGVLLGLSYNALTAIPDQSVSFAAGFFDLSEQTFSYSRRNTGGNKTILITSAKSTDPVLDLVGCTSEAAKYNAATVVVTDGVKCALTVLNNAKADLRLYPKVVRQPVVWNDTPYTIIAKDKDGLVLQIIPPLAAKTSDTALPSGKPTVLVTGVTTLAFDPAFPGTLTWTDPYVQARDHDYAKTTTGASYTIPDASYWRVIRVAARIEVKPAHGVPLDGLWYLRRLPGKSGSAEMMSCRYDLPAINLGHAVDLLYAPYSVDSHDPSKPVPGVTGCPTTVWTEHENIAVCGLWITPANWTRVIKDPARPGQILITPHH